MALNKALRHKRKRRKGTVPVTRQLESRLDMDRLIEEYVATVSLWDGQTLGPLPAKAFRSK